MQEWHRAESLGREATEHELFRQDRTLQIGEEVHPDLKNVIELQQVDLKIADLTRQIESLPVQIHTHQSQLDEFINAYEERKKRLAANQKERKEMDGDIKAIQEKISKHKGQLYEVKTNEQYRAMVKEIEGEETDVRSIEDRILEKMLEAEDIQKHIQEAAARLEGEKSRVAGEIAQLESQRRIYENERGSLGARRNTLMEGLSQPTRSLYERIRNARRGVAVAEVRDGLCTACNVLLRPQVYNEVRGNEMLLTCDNCGRIIYYLDIDSAPADEPDAHSADAPA